MRGVHSTKSHASLAGYRAVPLVVSSDRSGRITDGGRAEGSRFARPFDRSGAIARGRREAPPLGFARPSASPLVVSSDRSGRITDGGRAEGSRFARPFDRSGAIARGRREAPPLGFARPSASPPRPPSPPAA